MLLNYSGLHLLCTAPAPIEAIEEEKTMILPPVIKVSLWVLMTYLCLWVIRLQLEWLRQRRSWRLNDLEHTILGCKSYKSCQVSCWFFLCLRLRLNIVFRRAKGRKRCWRRRHLGLLVLHSRRQECWRNGLCCQRLRCRCSWCLAKRCFPCKIWLRIECDVGIRIQRHVSLYQLGKQR